jgi:nitric oxide reductase NorD protein
VASGAFFYDEWDYSRKAHRKRWCTVREREIEPDYVSDFVDDTLHRYRGHIKSLRRSFEALRDEYRTSTRWSKPLQIRAAVWK